MIEINAYNEFAVGTRVRNKYLQYEGPNGERCPLVGTVESIHIDPLRYGEVTLVVRLDRGGISTWYSYGTELAEGDFAPVFRVTLVDLGDGTAELFETFNTFEEAEKAADKLNRDKYFYINEEHPEEDINEAQLRRDTAVTVNEVAVVVTIWE